MLEIILVAGLAVWIGKIAKGKGRSGGGYIAMLIGLWIGGEIAGAVIGFSVGLEVYAIYGLAILGAIAGAVITFVVVACLSPLTPMMPPYSQGFPVIQSPQRPPY